MATRRGEIRPIDDLPDGSPVVGTDVVEVSRAGVPKKVLASGFGGGGGGGSWSLWGDVSAQTIMTGANGGTVFTDDTGKAVTRTGVTTVTAAPPTGFSSSTVFAGGTDKLSLASDEDFRLGSVSWQMEVFFKTTAGTVDTALLERSNGSFNAGSWAVLMNAVANSGKVSFWQSDISGAGPVIESAASFRDGAWHHLAVARFGNVIAMWVDGARVATTQSTLVFSEPAVALLIGNSVFASRGLVGNLAAFRMMRGSLLYTRSPVTVPTGPFPTS